jgi:hypothetical protein
MDYVLFLIGVVSNTQDFTAPNTRPSVRVSFNSCNLSGDNVGPNIFKTAPIAAT